MTTTKVMNSATNVAPTALLIIAVLTFIGVGIFHTDYYNAVFGSRFGSASIFMAIFLALIHESVRLGLLISSVRDFSDSKKLNGWLGLIGSIALVAYDISITRHVGELWANDAFDSSVYSSTIIFLILLGLLLEVRLVLTSND